jgi:holo-[acyl-carrier protein] synthase
MITGLGVDIVEISRIQKLLERYGEKFAHRLLTEQEFDRFQQRHGSATFLASRFAAKEAASKALGTGISAGMSFHSIEVVNDERGKPELRLHDVALALSQQQKVTRSLLSLSDEKHYAVATVVMESD